MKYLTLYVCVENTFYSIIVTYDTTIATKTHSKKKNKQKSIDFILSQQNCMISLLFRYLDLPKDAGFLVARNCFCLHLKGSNTVW